MNEEGWKKKLAESLPAWGEWIEICRLQMVLSAGRLSPHGESGLKFNLCYISRVVVVVSPRMGRVD